MQQASQVEPGGVILRIQCQAVAVAAHGLVDSALVLQHDGLIEQQRGIAGSLRRRRICGLGPQVGRTRQSQRFPELLRVRRLLVPQRFFLEGVPQRERDELVGGGLGVHVVLEELESLHA